MLILYQVILVDDEKMILNSLALGFDWNSNGFEVVATSTNSAEALRMIEFIRPDVVFTDIRMPGMSGIELMKKVHQDFPQIQFVVISGYSEFDYAREALTVGALAYCLKPLEDDEIEVALGRAKKILDAKKLVMQSAFSKMMELRNEENTLTFLRSLSSGINPDSRMYIAVCCGDASPLLVGNVCFSAVSLSEQCNMYLITSNCVYLRSISFQRMLLNAASQKQLLSFAFAEVASPVHFFMHDFEFLLQAALSHFINPDNFTFGQVVPAPLADNSTVHEQLLASTHQNRCMEVLKLLGELPGKCTLSVFDALQIHNLCNDLLVRTNSNYTSVVISDVFQLVEHYRTFEDMIRYLSRYLQRNQDAVNLDMVHNKTFRDILEYISQHFTQPISLQELCRDYCINPSYLSQLFKKELGVTFTTYITHLRIEHAKELLSTTNLRISEISERVGYDYYFNFTKLFKKETGLTPKQYRDQNLLE